MIRMLVAVSLLGSSFAALPAQAPAAAAAAEQDRSGRIRGNVEGHLVEGRRVHCRGVLLVPASADVDGRIDAMFGNRQAGTRLLMPDELARRGGREQPEAGARETGCGVFSSFSFPNVPAGDYYIVAFLGGGSPGTNDPSAAFAPRGLDLMRRVQVQPGRTIEVRFRQD